MLVHSLASKVDPGILGDLLGLALPQTTPGRATCPFCHAAELRVYSDPGGAGHWYWCARCEFAGDGVALVARHWDCTAEQAVMRLSQAGVQFPEALLTLKSLQRYQACCHALPAETKRLWQTARTFPWQAETAVVELLGRLRLVPLAGHCTRQAFGVLDTELLSQSLREVLPQGHQGLRCLPAKTWRYAVVIPLYDLPGRITGFYCLGRDGRRFDDVVFVPCGYGGHTHQHKPQSGHPECGVAYLDMLYQDTYPDWQAHAVVVPDILLAAQLHMRHDGDQPHPLPLLASYEGVPGRTQANLLRLEPRTYHYWHPDGNPLAIIHAFRTQSRVHATPPAKDWQLAIDRSTTLAVLNNVRKASKPSRPVLLEHFRGLSSGAAEGLLLQLGVDEHRLRDFVRQAPLPLQQRLTHLLDRRRRNIWLGHGWADHRPDGVYYNGELVCNAVLTIEELVTHKQQDRLRYRGTIAYREQTLPFDEALDVVESDPLKWLRRTLAKQGCVGFYCKPAFAHQLVPLALELHPPQSVLVDECVGWRPSSEQFVFPNFTIDKDGEVRKAFPHSFNPKVPAWSLQPPQPPPAAVLDRLEKSGEAAAALWRLLFSLTAMVVAPAVGRRAPRLLLSNTRDDAIAAVLVTMGCRPLELKSSMTPAKWETLVTEFGFHHWPYLLYLPRYAAATLNTISPNFPDGHIVFAPEAQRRVLSLSGRWLTWNQTSSLVMGQDLHEVFLAYLQDLVRRRFQFQSRSSHLLKQLQDDLASWYQHTAQRAPEAARSAFRGLVGCRRYALIQQFGKLVLSLLSRGYLHAERQDHGQGRLKTAGVRYLGNDQVFVDREVFLNALAEYSRLTPDLQRLNQAMATHPRGAPLCQYAGRSGWTVSERWLLTLLPTHARIRLHAE